MLKYACLASGYQFVIGAEWFTPQYLAKLNLVAVRQSIELFCNILPIRIKSFLLLNASENAMQVALNIAKALMSKKLKDRIRKRPKMVRYFTKNIADLFHKN